MKIKLKPSISFSFIILTFSVIYYIAWLVDPDSFIKNSALNSTPVHNAINMAFAYNDVAYEDPDNISSEEFHEQTLKAKKEFDRITHQSIELEKSLSQQEGNLKVISGNLSNAWGKNVQKHVQKMSREYLKELTIRKDEYETILSAKNQANESQINIMLSKKNVEIAEVKLKIATAESDALEYALSHTSEFNEPAIVSILNKANKEVDDTRTKLVTNRKRMDEIRSNVQNLLNKRQQEDLNFLDFTFYSIGISTTTTFGDLVANSRIIRMIVCIQLLLSILVLASVTQAFLSKKHEQ